jgi:hypothetical protein
LQRPDHPVACGRCSARGVAARVRRRARVRAEGQVRPDDRRRRDESPADPVAPGDDAGARLVRRRRLR